MEVEKRQLEQLMPLIQEKLDAGHSVRFSPSGISMRPMLREGVDSVLLSPLPEKLKKYDLPLYRRSDGKYILHRIVRAGETYTCVGDNQFEFETGLYHTQMIAVVSAFYRNGREVLTSNILYQLYCRFWHYTRLPRHIYRWGISRLRRLVR